MAIAPSDDGFQQISFVNSIATTKGGTHVNHVAEQVVERVLEHLKKKHKGMDKVLKPNHVKSHLKVFVNCLIENPAFDSQTKENMTLKQSAFGSKCHSPPPPLAATAAPDRRPSRPSPRNHSLSPPPPYPPWPLPTRRASAQVPAVGQVLQGRAQLRRPRVDPLLRAVEAVQGPQEDGRH